MKLHLDHVILAARDLDALVADVAQRTGVTAGRGGRHPGLGTHKALASLGADVYLELLAVDPAQRERLAGTWGARVDALPAPRLFGWMLRGDDLEGRREVLARHGIGADLVDASRATPDGRTLRWRLLMPHASPWGPALPNLIDWLDTAHPAATATPGLALTSFEVAHPQADDLGALLRALGADLAVEPAAQAALRLVVTSPRGEVAFTG
jgi:hypothetical protein